MKRVNDHERLVGKDAEGGQSGRYLSTGCSSGEIG